jgi:thiamine-phosphate pyrophosphorylase
VSALASARLYLVSGAHFGGSELAELVPELAAAGVDIIQLREKEMEAGDLLRVGARVAEACAQARVPFIVNDRPDVALALSAGVHLGQNDLPVAVARRILGGSVVGVSTHAAAEIDTAVGSQEPIDYIAVGPVYETPTKPCRPAVGVKLVRYAATAITMPWFAIGGIDRSNVNAVMEAGAKRVVVVRAITEASDPVGAAHELKTILETAPL